MYVDYLDEDIEAVEQQMQSIEKLSESNIGDNYANIALGFFEGCYVTGEDGTQYDLSNAICNTGEVPDQNYDGKESVLATKEIVKILQSEPLKPAKIGENSVSIDISSSTPDLRNGEYTSYFVFLSLSDEQLQQIFDLYAEIIRNQVSGELVLYPGSGI